MDCSNCHARSSDREEQSDLRACALASACNVTPFMPRLSAARARASQRSAGTRPRNSHLRTAQMLAPTSAAITSGEGHRSSKDRGVMPPSLGPDVLSVKAKVSYDKPATFLDTPSAMKRQSGSDEKFAFIARVRAAREGRFKSQKEICIILDLDQGTYKQYEIRTPLPHRYIPKFVTACGVSYEWLLSGEGAGPKVKPIPIPRNRNGRMKTKRIA